MKLMDKKKEKFKFVCVCVFLFQIFGLIITWITHIIIILTVKLEKLQTDYWVLFDMENKCIEFHLNVDDNKGSWKQQNIAPETTTKTNEHHILRTWISLIFKHLRGKPFKNHKIQSYENELGKKIYEKLCEFFSCFRQIRWRELLYVCIWVDEFDNV